MNVAFKHLEAKLRFGDLSIGQWAAVLGGVLFAFVFAEYLSPIGGIGGVIIGVYLGAIPASAAFFASLSEFDLWGLVAAAVRWHRRDGRYVPGAGETARGYALLGRRAVTSSQLGGARSGPGGAVGVKELRAAGELVAVEAIDRTGLVVTSEGAFVRVLRRHAAEPADPLAGRPRGGRRRVLPPDRAAAAGPVAAVLRRRAPGATRRAARRRAPRGRGVRRASADAGRPAPRRARRCRAGGCTRRWRSRCAGTPTSRPRSSFSAYVVIPYVPRQRDARAALAGLRRGVLARAPLERGVGAHRRAARESQAHVDALRAELEALGLPVTQLNGEQVFALLWARLNPTKADAGQAPASAPGEVLGELDTARDREQARQVALALREHIARSSVDLKRERHHVEVERDLEQVIYAHRTAQQTTMGWLMGAMLTRQPYTLSVYVHALDRRRERQKIKLGYRRLFAINRGAEQRGRVPDFDRYAQEHEYEQLLAEMAGHDRANVFEVSIYQAIRARGPAPDLVALGEAVDYCVEQLESASDCKVNRGEFRQPELWRARCRSAATSPAARASTRPATSATPSRWSAPRAGRRPGSRSRSPRPGARSSG